MNLVYFVMVSLVTGWTTLLHTSLMEINAIGTLGVGEDLRDCIHRGCIECKVDDTVEGSE